MEVIERLSLERAQEHDLLACVHIHRYALAAELCAGTRVLDIPCGSGYGSRILSGAAASVTGVDSHGPSIETARAKVAPETGADFVHADAHEFLARELGGDFDAIVMFEGLEHLDDPDRALTSLEHHARGGTRLILSFPNSRTLGERNPFHVSEFDYDRVMGELNRFDDVEVLYQFNAEGSLIRADGGDELDGRLVLGERGEPDYCNNFIALVNFGAAAQDRRAWARAQLAVAPAYNRHLVELEQANRELWRQNARLHRERLGVADSAAAAAIDRYDARRSAREEQRRREAIEEYLSPGLAGVAIRAYRFARRVAHLGRRVAASLLGRRA